MEYTSNSNLTDLSTTLIIENVSYTQVIIPEFNDNGVYACIWTSSDPSVVTVDSNGLVTLVGDGTATVSCTYNWITINCIIISST